MFASRKHSTVPTATGQLSHSVHKLWVRRSLQCPVTWLATVPSHQDGQALRAQKEALWRGLCSISESAQPGPVYFVMTWAPCTLEVRARFSGCVRLSEELRTIQKKASNGILPVPTTQGNSDSWQSLTPFPLKNFFLLKTHTQTVFCKTPCPI